jgi:tRNA threonylcarbamoyladenosine biosynthesis protein TsaE
LARRQASARVFFRGPTSGVSAGETWACRSRSLADTDRLGRRIGGCLRGGEVVALYGELGTGKTALVRGIASGLRASPRGVSSPTFVFIHEYHGKLPLTHVDLYRLQEPEELRHLGLEDYVNGHTVLAIEWADRAGRDLPTDRLEIRLSHRTLQTRTITLHATGAQSHRLLARLAGQGSARTQAQQMGELTADPAHCRRARSRRNSELPS